MDSRQPLKDTLGRIVDDISIIAKQLAVIMCVPKDQRASSREESEVSKLVELFKLKENELAEGMKIAEEQAERQKIIEQLKDEVRKRDQYIAKISACFKESEAVLINAIFQANQKLKSIGEANRKKVSPEELIKYAHRISATNSVAAPLTWQQGDPQRPYPLETEMWQGWPERFKERTKMDKEFSMTMNSGAVGSSSSGGNVAPGLVGPFQGQTPPQPQQHEFFMRPHQSSGIFPAPTQIPQSPLSAGASRPQMQTSSSAVVGGWTSPRGCAQTSPRTAPCSTSAGRPSARSPYGGGGTPATAPSACAALIAKTETAVDPVEQMSSDSSSSSDSDSQ